MKGFWDYGVEQSAALVEDYFYFKSGQPYLPWAEMAVTNQNREGLQFVYEETLSTAGLGPNGSYYNQTQPTPGTQSMQGAGFGGNLISSKDK